MVVAVNARISTSRNGCEEHKADTPTPGCPAEVRHLVMDVIDRLPKTGDKGLHLKHKLNDKIWGALTLWRRILPPPTGASIELG
jgi:hypothetical protein